MNRFTDITPVIISNPLPAKGAEEPNLHEILVHYYASHGVKYDKAVKLAKAYIKAWCILEASAQAGEITGGRL